MKFIPFNPPKVLFYFAAAVAALFILSLYFKPVIEKKMLTLKINAPTSSASIVTEVRSTIATPFSTDVNEMISLYVHGKIPYKEIHSILMQRLNMSLIQIVHQSWKTKTLIPTHNRISYTWKWCYPSWKHILWTDEDNRKLIEQNFPWFLSTYDNFPQNIFRADAMRYFYMFLYGGIYTDLDNECLKPFEKLLLNQSVVLGEMESKDPPPRRNSSVIPTSGKLHDYIPNSFMYSRVGHPFWLLLIRSMMAPHSKVLGDWTGSELVSTNIVKYEREFGTEGIYVYPSKYFDPFSWLHNSHTIPKECKTFNQMTVENYLACRQYFITFGSYVVQYHTHTW